MKKAGIKERLRELANEYGSVLQLSEKVGLQRQTVTNYIAGSRTPTSENLLKIAEETGVSVDWLLGITDKRIPNRDFQDACITLGIEERVGQYIYKLSHGTDEDKQVLDVLVGHKGPQYDDFVKWLKEYLSVSNFCISQTGSVDKATLPAHTFRHAGGLTVINTDELAEYLLYMASEAFRKQLQEFPYEKVQEYEPNVVDIPLDNDPK